MDYGHHCQYAFGTYVQAHDEPDPKNTNAPRTLDCIYLRYNDSNQGGHELLHLQTNRIIIRRKVTPIPITPAVIRQINHIAEQEGMPEGLKIMNRYGEVLYDSTWIAGVDYDQETFEDNDFIHEEVDETEEEDEMEDTITDEYDEMDPDDIAQYDDILPESEPHEIETENDQNEDSEDDTPTAVNDNENDEDIESEEENEDHLGTEINEQPKEGAIRTRSGRTIREPK